MSTNYNFEKLLNDHTGNITNKHVTKKLKSSSQSHLHKPFFFVEGEKIFSSQKTNKFRTGLKFGYFSKYNYKYSDKNTTLLKAKKALPNLESTWAINSYINHLKKRPEKFNTANKLNWLVKNETNKFKSNNINFTVPLKSKAWRKIKGGYSFRIGTGMYFLPGSHLKSKKLLQTYRRLFKKVLNLSLNKSLIGNKLTTVILQSEKTALKKTYWKINNQVVFKNLKQVSKNSKYVVSEKEAKKATSLDYLKTPTNSYNNSYYGKHIVA